MSENIFLFRDFYKISPLAKEETISWKDNLMAAPTNPRVKKGLLVEIEATHSCLINDNLRMYLASLMEAGTNSFVSQNKPVKLLKNHNPHEDPVGLIVGAKYVPTIPDSLKDDVNVKILTDKTAPIKEQLKAAKRFMKSGIPLSKDWKGLGYISLLANILDPITQEQVLDGRYDSVSTSFNSPSGAFCSHCQQNWKTDGLCEHELGHMYSDSEEDVSIPCVLIPAEHFYDECSLCVFGADPWQAIRFGSQDEKVKEYTISADTFNSDSYVPTKFTFKDIKEEPMATPEVTLSDSEKKVSDVIKTARPEMEDEKVLEFVKKIVALFGEDSKLPYQLEAELTDDVAILYALEDIETEGQEIDGEKIMDEMLVEFKTMQTEGLISEDELKEIDAKLSTEGRKKLAASTFCGPNRSFPVPDCAHVTAARRLIGRYKGPGNKSSILACVSRKAKALGCGGASDTVVPPQTDTTSTVSFVLPTCNIMKELKSEDVQAMFALAEAELISRNMKVSRECSSCASFAKEIEDLKGTNKSLVDKEAELNGTLKVLREEVQRVYADYSAQVDKSVSLGVELHNAKLEKVVLMSVLSGKDESLESATNKFKDMDISSFEKETVIINDTFDIEAVMKKTRNDGMAKEPEGKVETPLTNTDGQTPKVTDGLSAPAVGAIETIRDLHKDGQISHAKSVYNRMIQLKVLDPTKVPYAMIIAE